MHLKGKTTFLFLIFLILAAYFAHHFFSANTQAPDKTEVSISGSFVRWDSPTNLVIKKDGAEQNFDVSSGKISSVSETGPPQVSPEQKYEWVKNPPDVFQQVITDRGRQTWVRTYFERTHIGEESIINHERGLIFPNDGAIGLYDKCQIKGDLTNSTNVKDAAARCSKVLQEQNNPMDQILGFLHRKDDQDFFVALDHTASPFFLWGRHTGSSFDSVSGKYLLFDEGKSLSNEFIPLINWDPFEVLLFDPHNETLQRLVVPTGPWVQTDSPMRKLSCFSDGCDVYRHYDLKIAGNKIFISVVGSANVIDLDNQGVYELNPTAHQWIKIFQPKVAPEPAAASTAMGGVDDLLEKISPDGCKFVSQLDDGFKIINLCNTEENDATYQVQQGIQKLQPLMVKQNAP